MFGLTGFLNILVQLALIILIICVVWLLIPYFFRWFVAKHFDGSYDPKKDCIPAQDVFPVQSKIPKLVLDKDNKTYSLNFGEGRSFTYGIIKLHFRGNWYTSVSLPDCNKLEFVQETIKNVENTIGSAKKTTWIWKIPQTEFQFETSFLIYDQKDYILFEITSAKGIPETAIGFHSTPIILFPCFENQSFNKRIFTYRAGIFCPPQNDFTYTEAPVLLFDDAKNCVLLSAMNHFITNGFQKTLIGESQQHFSIGFGPNGEVKEIPSNYTQSMIMVFHTGINATFTYWGDILHKFYKAEYKDRYSDLFLSHLGYFTDNGAFYYYNPVKGQKYDYTLLEIKKHADAKQIPFQFYHLDSWWYLKSVQEWKRKLLGGIGRIIGGGLYGGTIRWEPDPKAFDMSLDELYQKLDRKPFSAHNRWYGLETTYLNEFKFIQEKNRAMPDDPKFWEHIMAYCKQNHIVMYEQDWMKNQVASFTHLRAEIGAAHRWLEDMAVAAEKNQVTIQYCMATPGMWMESVQFSAITNARASGDYAPRWPRRYDVPYVMQTSMLAAAVGIWPSKDTFESSRRGRINGERSPELMALISNLTAGPVIPGDEIGWIDAELLKCVGRSDGLLYKPNRPMTPADITYIKNRTYYICTTESIQGENKWYYILTINLWPNRVKDQSYCLNNLDIKGTFIEYNWFTHECRRVDENTVISQKLKEEQYRYRIYAPLLKNGCAILGDPTKFIMMNDKEFVNISENANGISITISNIANETTRILIYTESQPKTIQLGDKIITEQPNDLENSFIYDSTTKHLFITVKFHTNETKILSIH